MSANAFLGISRPARVVFVMMEHGALRRYTASVQPVDLGAAAAQPGGSEPMATADYLPVEHAEEAKCAQMFEVIRKYEASRSINFQARTAPQQSMICTRCVRRTAVHPVRAGVRSCVRLDSLDAILQRR